MIVCSLPALTASITFMFLPESPKFLMTTGKNTEALAIFKRMYKTNTGRQLSSFPV